MPEDSATIYLAKERAVVCKQLKATGGVRVHTIVHADEEMVVTPVTAEETEVLRVPLDRWVDAPVPERQEGDTRIITRLGTPTGSSASLWHGMLAQ